MSVHSSYLLGNFFTQVALDAANEAFNASAGRLRKLYAVRMLPVLRDLGDTLRPSGNGSAIYTVDGLTSVLLAGKGVVFMDKGDPQQTSH